MRRLLTLLALPFVAVSGSWASTEDNDTLDVIVKKVATDVEDNDFPLKYRDKLQNVKADGTESATVVRLKRGGYMLVADSLFKPQQISKKYEHKRMFDKFMFEAGGALTYGMARNSSGAYGMGTKPGMGIGVGDWVTPEHGWRVDFTYRQLPLSQLSKGVKTALNPITYEVGINYMLNFNAIVNRAYPAERKLEVLGLLGADVGLLNYSQSAGGEFGRLLYGGHIGLRGMYNFKKPAYLYVEPRLEVYKPGNALRPKYFGGDGYAIGASLTAGVGLRRYPSVVYDHHNDTVSAKGNDWFLQMAGGLSMPSESTTSYGPIVNIGVGKWINRCNGLRVRFVSGMYGTLPGATNYRLMHIGAGVDYLWNISRFFSSKATYNRLEEPRFSANLALGGSYALNDRSSGSRHSAIGAGVGLLFNVRIAKSTDVYIEPRLDLYNKNYLPSFPAGNEGGMDGVASVVAGFTFHQGMHTAWLRESRNPDFNTGYWRDHFFMQLAAGGVAPVSTSVLRAGSVAGMVGPVAQLTVGKWFTPLHGVRAYGEAGYFQTNIENRKDYFGGLGFDYMWNITNALVGYREYRPFEFISGFGVNLGVISHKFHKPYPGFSSTLQAHYNVTRRWSIYLEPQLRLFGKKYLDCAGIKIDPVASVMLGTQIRTLGGYDFKEQRDTFNTRNRAFFGAALAYTQPSDRFEPGISGRFEVGRWYTPASAVRGYAHVTGYRTDPLLEHYRNVRLTFGADYMVDITNLAYGYNPERFFNLRPLVGGSVGWSFLRHADKGTLAGDMHLGVQGAFYVGHNTEVYVEPQLLYYIYKGVPTSRLRQINPAVYFGVSKRMLSYKDMAAAIRRDVRAIREANAENHPWSDDNKIYNKLFLEMGGGFQLMWSGEANRHKKEYMGEAAYAALGRWITPQMGLRLRLHGARMYRPVNGVKDDFTLMGFGVEYVHSISNAIWRYNPERLFDVNALVGPHFVLTTSQHMHVGFNIGVQPLLNLSKNYSLFLLPEITFYKRNALLTTTRHKKCIHNNILFGLQVHPQNYDVESSRRLFDEGAAHSFFSGAGGLSIPLYDVHPSKAVAQGRFSFGHWFTPFSAWRVSAVGGITHCDFHSNTNAIRTSLGGDYILDMTTLGFGYKDYRFFHLRALAGVNLGMNYMQRYDRKLHFLPDLHVGAQFAFCPSRRVEIFLEPQIAHVWSGAKEPSRLSRVHPTAFLGLNYNLATYSRHDIADEKENSPYKNFVCGALGSGSNTQIVIYGPHFSYRFTMEADVSYGRWLDVLNGVRVGVSNSYYNISHRKKNNPLHQDNVTLHVDYMLNLVSLFRGSNSMGNRVEMNAFAGLTYGLGFVKNRDMYKGFGGEAGFQLGGRVSKHVGIYMEPAVQMTSCKLSSAPVPHPFEAVARLLVGTRYSF